MQKANYQPLTVDAVVFELSDGQLSVLLSKVASEPFRGEPALPGGYCLRGETTQQTMDRVLLTKAGIDSRRLGLVEQLYAFDTTTADEQESHAVSVAYLGLAKDVQPQLENADRSPAFVPLADLPRLAYDQNSIVEYALDRLRSKFKYTTVAAALLPELFTLATLQTVYETILGHPLDKSNFRKRFISYDVLDHTDHIDSQGAHRPARMYKFRDTRIQPLYGDFE